MATGKENLHHKYLKGKLIVAVQVSNPKICINLILCAVFEVEHNITTHTVSDLAQTDAQAFRLLFTLFIFFKHCTLLDKQKYIYVCHRIREQELC
jgi:hypothetical protein